MAANVPNAEIVMIGEMAVATNAMVVIARGGDFMTLASYTGMGWLPAKLKGEWGCKEVGRTGGA